MSGTEIEKEKMKGAQLNVAGYIFRCRKRTAMGDVRRQTTTNSSNYYRNGWKLKVVMKQRVKTDRMIRNTEEEENNKDLFPSF